MSAEGKKKRGVSGATNAKSVPFRYNGYPRNYTLSERHGPTRHPRLGGTKFLTAMVWGAALPGYSPSERMYAAADAVIEYVTDNHPSSMYSERGLDIAETF